MWPGYDGVDRGELRRIASEFGGMYGDVVRSGDRGAKWPAYDERDGTIMWLVERVEPKRNLLNAEWKAFHAGGIETFAILEAQLVKNT